MKKFKNIAIIAVAMVLVFALGVGATLAYFVSESDPVTNTFIPTKFGEPEVTETTTKYVAIPGVSIDKNPRVKYTPGTNTADQQAEAYLYLTIKLAGGWTTSDHYSFTNKVGAAADANLSFTLISDNWKYIGTTSGLLVYVYIVGSNEQKLTGTKTGIGVITDDEVKVSSSIVKDDMDATDIATKLGSVTFGAYAVQAKIDGVSGAKNAWNTVNSSLKIS